jgi:phosphatidylserine decarboxylase
VLESRAIHGKIYLDVTITTDGEFDTPDGACYQFTQARGLIIFDSPFGLAAVLPIGMAQVPSVHITAIEGSYFHKGDNMVIFSLVALI